MTDDTKRRPPDPVLRGIDQLLQIMRDLRDPLRGCPWDLEQNFQSLVPHTIEEAYEVADAVETGTPAALCDELGDLLLQVVFYAQIAQDDELFDFDDVARAVTEKMLRRHPHIYVADSDAQTITTAAQQESAWDAIKASERAGQGDSSSVLDGVTAGLPAATRAMKLQKRAATVGFDWDTPGEVADKVREELDELLAECPENNAERLEDEFGDLFFSVMNLARHLKLDPEAALRRANRKFERRFRVVEKDLSPDKEASLAEMTRAWERAKVTAEP